MVALIVLPLIISIFFGILLYISSPKWYVLRPKAIIEPQYREELLNLGIKAFEIQEVPIASIIVYDGQIIGRGYNTVNTENNAGGHAEINAISDVFSKMGQQGFRELDRSKLVLYSTFEPCMMCQGAMQDYKIKIVVFIKSKPLRHWLRVRYNYYLYQALKHKSKKDILQDTLFRLYPDYKE